jgi:hypothetical protein
MKPPTGFADTVTAADVDLQRAILAESPGVAMAHLQAACEKVQKAYAQAAEASRRTRLKTERADLEASWQ